jgi:transmembrane sensor
MHDLTPRDRREAEKWVVRMLDDPDRHRPALSRWMLAKPGRRQLYENIYAALEDAGTAWTSAPAARPELGGPSTGTDKYRPPARPRSLAAMWLIAPIGLLAILMLLAFERAGQPLVLAAESDEMREHRLDGGTLVKLQPDSRLEITAQDGTALLRLTRGQARIAVPSSAARTVIVAAQGSEMQTGGAIFDVSLRNRLALAIKQGDMIVRLAAWSDQSPSRRSIRLRAGDSLAYAKGQISGSFAGSGRGHSPRVGYGLKSYDNVPISALIEEANRISATKIVLADPRESARRIDATVRINDPRAVASAVAAFLGSRVDMSAANKLTIRAKGPEEANSPQRQAR